MVSRERPENAIDPQPPVSDAASFISALKTTPGLVLIFGVDFWARVFFGREGQEANHKKMFSLSYFCCRSLLLVFYAAFNDCTDVLGFSSPPSSGSLASRCV